MKTYESASLVDLGNANDLVLGFTGVGPDSGLPDPELQIAETFADVDE